MKRPVREAFVIASLAAVLSGGGPARAAESQEEITLQRVSRDTGVGVETLREERGRTGFTLGDLRTAHLMAARTGRSFEEVVAERQAGKPWQQMARESGLSLRQVLRRSPAPKG